MSDRKLYFIAIIPPDDPEVEICKLKNEAHKLFDSKHALNSPGHITLVPPFQANASLIVDLKKDLKILMETRSEFAIEFDNFGYFKPKVVFIQLVKSNPLFQLREDLKKYFEISNDFEISFTDSYHPHITIAFKDLRKKMFYEAKEYFDDKTFQGSFRVKKIFLLYHDNKKWNVDSEFLFFKKG